VNGSPPERPRLRERVIDADGQVQERVRLIENQ
jgi:hypothetical protein